MRLKLISCEVFGREMAAASARSPNQIEVEFLTTSLHKKGCLGLRRRLQLAIDRADRAKFQGILLGYGLCSSDLSGLRARTVPVVIPRACDCFGRLLLFQHTSEDQLLANDATFHLHSSSRQQSCASRSAGTKLPATRNKPLNCGFEQLAARYGSEVARYLYHEFSPNPRLAGTSPFLPVRAGREGRRTATPKTCWAGICETSPAAKSLVQRMVDGYWSYEDFVVLAPGWQLAIAHDGHITAEEAPR